MSVDIFYCWLFATAFRADHFILTLFDLNSFTFFEWFFGGQLTVFYSLQFLLGVGPTSFWLLSFKCFVAVWGLTMSWTVHFMDCFGLMTFLVLSFKFWPRLKWFLLFPAAFVRPGGSPLFWLVVCWLLAWLYSYYFFCCRFGGDNADSLKIFAAFAFANRNRVLIKECLFL